MAATALRLADWAAGLPPTVCSSFVWSTIRGPLQATMMSASALSTSGQLDADKKQILDVIQAMQDALDLPSTDAGKSPASGRQFSHEPALM